MTINNFVLGSEGFVGKPFCTYLESKKEKVHRFDLKLSAEHDLRYTELNFEGIDRIYFLAWDVGGSKYLYNTNTQLDQLEWNLKMLSNVMPQIHKSNLPFLFVSSQLAEVTELAYGVMKRVGEVWSKQIGGACVRLWNVYGPIETPSERTHVVADLIYQAITTNTIRLMTNGEEKRQFVHIDDVCSAFHRAITLKTTEIYDVTSFEWISIYEVAQMISELTEAKLKLGEKMGSTPITPIKGKIPGWQSNVHLKKGIEIMVQDMKSSLSPR